MRATGLVVLALSGLLLQGCDIITAAGGPDYTQESERTFTAPIEQVRDAARDTLSGMKMTVNEDSVTDDGRRLRAGTWDRTVRIDLENVTYNMTRMSVSVTRGDNILKDHVTEQQILTQINDALNGTGSAIGSARGAQ